ncbi:DUF7389 domain-containing protein [Haladaptatus sp. DFWS20]|uniref:DUF7389 domain-containing protein n=1 Tax=Haladaptatus sp. DFWS20 TaxID=3403467 RepID=UPI003EC07BBA
MYPVQNPSHQQKQYVEWTDVGVSFTVKLTRSTSTCDQDKVTTKVKATMLDEAREDMETLRTYVTDLTDDVR